MVSKLATDCMAQRAQRFFYKDWYAQNYNYCYDHIIQLSTILSQHPYIKGRRFLWWRIVKNIFVLAFYAAQSCLLSCLHWAIRKLLKTSVTQKDGSLKTIGTFPPALVARAKVLFDEGYFINTDLYKFIKKEYGFQAAEDFRFWWIRSELIKHQER